MTGNWKDATLVSLLLHGGVFLVLGLTTLVAWFWKPEPPDFVFTLAADLPEQTSPAEPTPRPEEPAPETPPVEIALPVLPETEPLRDLPEAVEPQPLPVPSVVPTETAPPRLSYEDFLRENPDLANQPRTVTRQPTPTRPRPSVRLDVADLQRNLDQFAQTQGRTATAAERDRMAHYLQQVFREIDRAWQRPDLGRDDLRALVQFEIRRDGTLANIRFISSSGTPAFDDTIREAFRRVGRVPPPPEGVALNPRLVFEPR